MQRISRISRVSRLSTPRGLAAAAWSPPLGSVVRKEPRLFTPGPLTTSATVKQAMLVDLGSRDPGMIRVIQECRDGLLAMAGTSQAAGFECVLVQGSGTFAIESVVSSVVPPPAQGGKLLVVSNGAYGLRMAQMARMGGIDVELLECSEREAPTAAAVVAAVKEKGPFTHVGMIHHETTAGTLNPVEEVGAALRSHDAGISFIVDSMSAFGAYDCDLEAGNVAYLVHMDPCCGFLK